MTTRIYVPSSIAQLRELLVAGGVGPVPVLAHAVTEDLRSALPDAGEEELEYAALTDAAQSSLGLLTDEDEPRRVVVVAEAGSVMPAEGQGSLVEVDEVVPLRKVVAVHADSDDAAAAVAAARAAWPAAESGEEEALAALDQCLTHELGWFATQEIGELVEE